MTIAEIRGKIADSGTNLSERMEDLLTSDVFGCLRYIPAERVLLPFLETGLSFHGSTFRMDDEVAKVHSAFWPWLTPPGCIPCEPDVVFGFETDRRQVHIVMIEAKYYSELSSEEDQRPEPNDQLARELDNLNSTTAFMLKWNPNLEVASRSLVYVTQDMGMPRDDIANSLAEYERKRGSGGDIYWTSWRLLAPILETELAAEADPTYRAVIGDLLKLMLRKGLTMFRGVQPCLFRLASTDFEFYSQAARWYSWPDTPELEHMSPHYVYRMVNHG